MSSYISLTLDPRDGAVKEATWIDDFFGRHRYGVRFPDGEVIPDTIVLNPQLYKGVDTVNAYEWAKQQQDLGDCDLGPNMTEMNGELEELYRTPFMNETNRATAIHNGELHQQEQRATTSLLAERGPVHGDFTLNAKYGQELRKLFRQSPGWLKASDREREALDYIAGKISRILSGRPDHADHWEDIAGYATLAARPDTQ